MRAWIVGLWLFVSAWGAAWGQVAAPAALEPWRAWVMKDQAFRACPLMAGMQGAAAGDFLCAWPGELRIDADADGASFAMRWTVDAPGPVPLPGSSDHWPQEVSVDGRAVPVVAHEGRPVLWLELGTVEVRGRIPWRQRPQVLAVPQAIGQVALRIDGRAIVPLQREQDTLTLGRAAGAAAQADALAVRVYRRLVDGVPAMLETRIVLAGSGQVREMAMGPVLPTGFVPVSLSGDWPARIDGEGRLHLQVQPETAELVLMARALAQRETVEAPAVDAPWPAQELWSFQPDPAVRVARADAAVQVDPAQAGVPEAWRNLPAFALAAGQALQIEERSRGLSPDQANRLTLEREAWLDHDGGGWYLRDRISGQMRRDWRLDVAPPLLLLRASAQSQAGDTGGGAMLVTEGDDGALGVQWHRSDVALDAGLRGDSPYRLPATGWRQAFDAVTATLHVPDGFRLFAAPGADAAHGSWLGAWTLLDVFVVAVVSLLAWHAFGWLGAAAVVGYLLLGFHERAAPVFPLGAVIALLLVARALPEGRLRRVAQVARGVFLTALVLLAVPFAAAQLRMALYPQLEGEFGGWGMAMRHPAAPVVYDEAAQEAMLQSQPAPAPMAKVAEAVADRIVVSGSRLRRDRMLEQYSRDTVTQTGPGEPAWRTGRSYRLEWRGPVLEGQMVRLWLSPPWLTRALRVLLVGLLALVLLRILRDSGTRAPGRGSAATPAGAAAAFVFALLAMPPAPAAAQAFPSQELLDEYRARLTEAPRCAPACATLAQARVSAVGDALRLAAEVHAQERVAFPLPRVDDALVLESVTVDGAAATGIARHRSLLHVPVARGVHRIEAVYRAVGDRATLGFPQRPQRLLFAGEDWVASGVADERLLADSLVLSRVREPAAGSGMVAQQFPPYVRVVRRIELGLEWRVTTRVERVAPERGGFSVRVPVIAGESVLTGGLDVVDGVLELPLADGAPTAFWQGGLDKADAITLAAPGLDAHAEEWRFVVAPMWRVAFAGVPESIPEEGEGGDLHEFVFYPLPGETLAVSVTRPPAAPGATRAIDAVQLQGEAGQRAGEHRLVLTLRASQGGEHVIALPADAEVLGVARDGERLDLRPAEGRLGLPVQPGSQRFEVNFRTNDAAGLRTALPQVALGLPAANIDLSLQLPADRWVWFTHGPRSGPAVLYWGELIVLLAVAFALARSRHAPLGLRQWLLLGIGFSTFSWPALLLVVAWLFALGWRARLAPERLGGWFNLVQVGLALLTLSAYAVLLQAIPHGLLGLPDMHVVGNGSSAHDLRWFADRSEGSLPTAGAVSVPLWVYRVLMLAWALWLANAVIGWSRQAFAAWTQGGYWRSRERRKIEEAKGDE